MPSPPTASDLENSSKQQGYKGSGPSGNALREGTRSSDPFHEVEGLTRMTSLQCSYKIHNFFCLYVSMLLPTCAFSFIGYD